MITVLDNQSWAKELVTGNAEFVQTNDASLTLWIVSNVRLDNTFLLLRSNPIPPAGLAPGPGSTFTTVATFNFGPTQVDFDPVAAFDSGTGKLHIIGTRTNPTNNTLIDLVKWTYDTTFAGPFPLTLGAPKVLVSGFRTQNAYDIVPLTSVSGHSLVAVGVDEAISYDPAGLNITPSVGMNLVVMELDANNAVVPGTVVELKNSPTRSGDTYGSVSLVTSDGTLVELYYESHPKVLAFADQLFRIIQFNRNASAVWDAGTELIEWQGRFTDSRLTVIAQGTKRLLSQQYYSQLNFPEGLTGNLVLGYINTPQWSNVTTYVVGNQVVRFGLVYQALTGNTGIDPATDNGTNWKKINGWLFHTLFGTVAGGSIVEGTTSMSQTQGMNLVYLLEPFTAAPNVPALSWPLHVANISTTLDITEVPGFYNNQQFTWLRGTKSIVDDNSLWAVVGERVQAVQNSGVPFPFGSGLFGSGTFGTNILVVPVFASLFNVPPVAQLLPGNAIVYRGGSGYDLGAGFVPGDLPLDASGTTDADSDPLTFIWSESDPDLKNVVLTPNGARATLDVARAVGGAGRSFRVGVAAIDLTANLLTQRHPASAVTNIVVASSVLTVTVNNNFAVGQSVMLYNLTLNPPAAPVISETPGGSLVARNYFFKITYLNAVGETIGSAEATLHIDPNNLAVVTSPAALGDAASYNVYASKVSGQEQLQNFTPIPLGTNFVEPTTGLINGIAPPLQNTALLANFNDQVLTVATSSPTQFTVTPFPFGTGAFGTGIFGANTLFSGVLFGSGPFGTGPFGASFPSTAVTGSVIPQFQFGECTITVPTNAAPFIGPMAPIAAARNAQVVIAPTITGVTDHDDQPFYTWTQTSGTPVTVIGGFFSPTLTILTNGVDIHGETLTFHLVAGDGINATAQGDFTVNVASYNLVPIEAQSRFLARAVWFDASPLPPYGFGLFGAGAFATNPVTLPAKISKRNTPQQWGALNVSALKTELSSIKRISVLDGTDRYIMITPTSVLVFGGINPNLVLLRRLFIPNGTAIVDAVHTEADYTLVLDANMKLYRYSTVPAINTDNPDTTIDLTTIAPGFTFNKIFSTPSFSDARVLVLSGPNGVLLFQVRSSTMQTLGFLELSVEDNFIYGVDNVQYVRTSGLESLRLGKILIGTLAPSTAPITNISITNDAVVFTAQNNFSVGTRVKLAGLTKVPDLNGVPLDIFAANPNGFSCSFTHANVTATTETGTATATNAGRTFETIVDLVHGQIVGSFDSTRTRNQFVNTGEILFEPNSSYAGRPTAPVLAVPTSQNGLVTISWTQARPDLIYAYNVYASTDGGTTFNLLSRANSGVVQSITTKLFVGVTYKFRVQAFGQDGISPFSNVQTITVS